MGLLVLRLFNQPKTSGPTFGQSQRLETVCPTQNVRLPKKRFCNPKFQACVFRSDSDQLDGGGKLIHTGIIGV